MVQNAMVATFYRYRLCSIKMCEMGKSFDKNSFISGTKLSVLKKLLLIVEREVQFP